MESTEHAASGKCVYICGKSNSAAVWEFFSLKGRLVSDLSLNCFVRTHPSPVVDMIDSYCAIASSNAFVFILNNHTLYDPDCLNQLGVAILYNIPVIAVRIENFELPKPLPLRFYETRFVDKRGSASTVKKDASQSDIPLTLAGVILACYEASVVCKTTSYLQFLNEVIGNLSNKTAETANGTSMPENSCFEDDVVLKTETRSAAQARLARAGLGSSRNCRRGVRNGNSSSSAHKQKGLQSIYGGDQKLLNRQPLINRYAYKKIDLTLSSIPSLFNRGGKKPPKSIGRQAFSREQTFVPTKGKENRSVVDHSTKGNGIIATNAKGTTITTSPCIAGRVTNLVEVSKVASSSAQNLTIAPRKSDNELAVPVVGPKGRKLRRYSSLPVVPTQYMVASEKKSGSPQILSFPPPNSSSRSESPYFFSGDELDFDPIHISRTCTPVDAFESTSLPETIDKSSR